jgi:arginyl-tRNA synthetase
MSLLSELTDLVGGSFEAVGLDRSWGEVMVSTRPDFGQFQCNGALAAAKRAGRPPREIAAEVARLVVADPRISAAEVAGAGFVNLTVTDEHLAEVAAGMAASDRLGVPEVAAPQVVVVDYAGPNVAKAMHVGHVRATIIGDCLARLFRFAGHRVVRDPHFGDWGFQIGVVIAHLEDTRPELPYFRPGAELPAVPPLTLDDLQRIYPEATSRARRDPDFAQRARHATVDLQRGRPEYLALWDAMKGVSEASQRLDFADLGVEFDLWYGESDVAERLQPLVDELVAAGVAVESEGAWIIDVREGADNRELPPLILATSLGGFLYSTTDLATLQYRVKDLGANLILYVVDARQADHFEQVFRAGRKAGILPETVTVEHVKFGTMNGADGKPFKTRDGGVVRLRDLIDMVNGAALRRLDEAHIAESYPAGERAEIAHRVGIAALKFADLVNNRQSNYVFDLERFTSFEGKTGPYLQYGTVRIASILRNATERGVGPGPALAPREESERALVLELARLPEVIDRAIALRAPNQLAEYAFEVTGRFNRFYETCHILSEPDTNRRGSWLGLVDTTRRLLVLTLDLLGIGVPERM